MLTHTDLKKGAQIIVDGQPCEVLEATPQRYAQRKLMIQTKIRNLLTGSVLDKTVHQGETFEEAELERVDVKFVYNHRGKLIFCEAETPTVRFELPEEKIGQASKFLKSNQVLTGIKFNGKIVNIVLPVKVQLKVTDAPPGVKGERAQAGTKQATLESGAIVNVPLFVEEGDIIEINTESGEYVKRVE